MSRDREGAEAEPSLFTQTRTNEGCIAPTAHMSQSLTRGCIAGVQHQPALIVLHRLSLVALDGMNVSEVVIGHGETGVHPLSRRKGVQGLRVLAYFSVLHADLRIYVGVGMLRSRLLKFRDGLLGIAGAIIGQRPIEQQVRFRRFQRGGFLKLVDRIAATRRLKVSESQLKARPQLLRRFVDCVLPDVDRAAP